MLRTGLLVVLFTCVAAVGAPAAAAAANLPSGETVHDALAACDSGSCTPGEAMVAKQTLYYEARLAGMSDGDAGAYANEQVAASTEGASGDVADLWSASQGYADDGTEAADSAGELLDLAVGDEALGEAVSGACLATAGLVCAAAAAVGVGGLVYDLLSGGGGFGGLGGAAAAYFQPESYVVANTYVEAGPDDQYRGQVSACGAETSAYSWSFAGFGAFPCDSGPLIFDVMYVTQLGGTGFSDFWAPRAQMILPSIAPDSGTCPSGGDGSPLHNVPIIGGDDPALPAYTAVGPGSEGLTWPLATDGWTWANDGTGTCTSGAGAQTWNTGVMVEPPSAVKVGFPHAAACGDGCSTVTGGTLPSLGTLATELGQGAYSNANTWLTATAGGTDESGDPVAPPGASYMPSCLGLTLSACESTLAAAGYTGTVTGTTAPCSGQDSGYGAGDVVGQTPAAGSEVAPSAGVDVVENPSPACIPVPTPTTAETAAAYEGDLAGVGFTAVRVDQVSDENESADAGPDGVVEVSHAGTAIAYGTLEQPATSLVVEENPDDAPAATGAPTGSAPTAPSLPGITIPSPATPCTVFPFGIPCWIGAQLSQLTASPVAPSWTLTLPAALGGGSWTIDLGTTIFGVSLSSIMAVVRPVLLLLSFLGLVYWLGGLALGGSTGGGGTAEAEE